MTYQDIKQRVSNLDPIVVDSIIAVALTIAVCLQIWLFSQPNPGSLAPRVPNLQQAHLNARGAGFTQYVWVAATFLPLALRRKIPWLALALSGVSALVYQMHPFFSPAPIMFAPMLALYSLAAHAKKRSAVILTVLIIGVLVAVPLFAFSSSVRWVAELVGAFVMLAAAALFGEAERTRRDYMAEYEQRAVEAERTREEEALRRVDEERIRIAREVHDIVAHSLSIVTVQAGAALTLLDSDVDGARESMENVRSTSKQALAELRSMLDVLRTGESDAPLAPTADITHVETLATAVRDAGIEVDLDVVGDLQGVPAFAAVSAYRIVQEALTNIVRHANASSAHVAISSTAPLLTIDITDNGPRSIPENPETTGGHGLRGMRERVEALGGTFAAGPAPTSGFNVHVTIPLSRSPK